MIDQDLPEKRIQEVSGEIPKAVRVQGLSPEYGEHLTNLVAAVSVGSEVSPRTRHNSYEGGFDDARHLASSTVTHLRQLLPDDGDFAKAVVRAMTEIVNPEASALAAAYENRADLAQVLAERVAKTI